MTLAAGVYTAQNTKDCKRAGVVKLSRRVMAAPVELEDGELEAASIRGGSGGSVGEARKNYLNA